LLARRARRLAGRRCREAAARGIDRVLEDAREPLRHGFTSAIPVHRREVLDAAPALSDLAGRLRDDGPIDPAVVARVRLLLSDGAGPLFVPAAPGELRETAAAVAGR
jgi:hypothetical protein